MNTGAESSKTTSKQNSSDRKYKNWCPKIQLWERRWETPKKIFDCRLLRQTNLIPNLLSSEIDMALSISSRKPTSKGSRSFWAKTLSLEMKSGWLRKILDYQLAKSVSSRMSSSQFATSMMTWRKNTEKMIAISRDSGHKLNLRLLWWANK